MNLPKIPDDIYEKRCRFCHHFCKEGENRAYEDREYFSVLVTKPCKIQEIAQYKYQIRRDFGTGRGSYENVVYSDGECRSFTPLFSYPGICYSCKYHNIFMEGFCSKNDEKKNYRIAMIGMDYGREDQASRFGVCDNWKISELAKHCIEKDLAYERVPLILDPKTYKLLRAEEMSEKAAEWARLQREAVEKRLASEEAKKRDQQRMCYEPEPEQLTMNF